MGRPGLGGVARRRVLMGFGGGDVEVEFVVVAQDGEGGFFADAFGGQEAGGGRRRL